MVVYRLAASLLCDRSVGVVCVLLGGLSLLQRQCRPVKLVIAFVEFPHAAGRRYLPHSNFLLSQYLVPSLLNTSFERHFSIVTGFVCHYGDGRWLAISNGVLARRDHLSTQLCRPVQLRVARTAFMHSV